MKLTLHKDLGALRERALTQLDVATAVRRKEITGPNADVHAAKAAEARALLDGRGGNFPLLDAEAAAKGINRDALARQVLDLHDASQARLAAIEVERQDRQLRIRAAAAPAAIDAVLAELTG